MSGRSSSVLIGLGASATAVELTESPDTRHSVEKGLDVAEFRSGDDPGYLRKLSGDQGGTGLLTRQKHFFKPEWKIEADLC